MGKLKIDIHTHILSLNIPNFKEKFGYGGFVRLQKCEHTSCQATMISDNGNLFREVEQNCWDPYRRIQEMDDQGISHQALSTVPVMFNYWAKPEHTLEVCEFINNELQKAVATHPQRFFALGTLPMQAPEFAVKEMRRCVSEYGFKGFQIGTHINEWNLDAEELHPVWKAAQDLDVAFFVHPWDMEMGGRMKNYWLPWLVGMPKDTCVAITSLIMGGVFQKFPTLRMVFAHGGGSFPFTLPRINHGFLVRPDLCAQKCSIQPKNFLNRIWVDSLVHDPKALEYVVGVLGEDHVMLGSDYPFPLGELKPSQAIEESSLSEEGKEKLFWKTAAAFFKLDL